jgi:hypothetical protein
MAGLIVLLQLSTANSFQAFDVGKVQPPNPDQDFTNVKENTIQTVQGRGWIIEWRNSKVTVYEKDNEGKRKGTALRSHSDGQLRVDVSWELYIAGGKFIEIEED